MKRLLSFGLLLLLTACSLSSKKKDPPPEIKPVTLHSITETFKSEFEDASVNEISYYFKSETYVYEIYGQNEEKNIRAKYMAEDGGRFSLDMGEEIENRKEIIKEDLDVMLLLIGKSEEEMEASGVLDSWSAYENGSHMQMDIVFVDELGEDTIYSYDIKSQTLLNKESRSQQ